MQVKNKFIFGCLIFKKCINHLSKQGKKQKIERFVYNVFNKIKRKYSLKGVIMLYEAIQLLIPPFLLVPIMLNGKIQFLPVPIRRHKKIQIAVQNFAKSILLEKKIQKGQIFENVVLETLLLIVFERQNSALTKKSQQISLTVENKKLLHFRW
jgi:ribosomal protein S7